MIIRKAYYCFYCDAHLPVYTIRCDSCGVSTANKKLKITEIDETSVAVVEGRKIAIVLAEDTLEVEHYNIANITFYIHNIGSEVVTVSKINFPYWETLNRDDISKKAFTIEPQSSKAITLEYDTKNTSKLGRNSINLGIESNAVPSADIDFKCKLYITPFSKTNPIALPGSTKIITQHSTSGDGDFFLIKSKGSLKVGGGGCLYYIESGGHLIDTGGGSILFVQNGAIIDKNVGVSVVYYENEADIEHLDGYKPSNPNFVKIPKLTFEISNKNTLLLPSVMNKRLYKQIGMIALIIFYACFVHRWIIERLIDFLSNN